MAAAAPAAASVSLVLSKCFATKSREEEAEDERFYRKYDELVSGLPVDHSWPFSPLYKYRGFWLPHLDILKGMIAAEEHFRWRPDDVLLVSFPKVGTTWLKSLVFAVVNRDDHPYPLDSLVGANPHECVPFLETGLYTKRRIPNLDILPSPRVLATHAPYPFLPKSTSTTATNYHDDRRDNDHHHCSGSGSGSGGKIVYLCRDPKDTVVSFWHFTNRMVAEVFEGVPVEAAFEPFCRGLSPYGPFWDHALGYWEASLERPDKVLFLMYEDLMAEPRTQLKRLAEFVGQYPFSRLPRLEEKEKEKENGNGGGGGYRGGGEKGSGGDHDDVIIDKILKLCSFENLSGLEINKTGNVELTPDCNIHNSAFFRKGRVGDWVTHLTPEMAQRLDRVVEEKLRGSGLTFTSASSGSA